MFFLMEAKVIKAVIFDMDGVLIEAKDWHFEALNKALGLFGYNISRFEHLTSFDGLPTRTKLERLSVEKGLPEGLHKFINEIKQDYTMQMVCTLCRPRFHHEYALSKLKAEGFKLVVASNSIRKTIEAMMEKSELSKYLDFFLSNEDVDRPKPNPEIYIKAIHLLGLLPRECLIVEDNENGIKAALASGAHVMSVSDVDDVNYRSIMDKINFVNRESK
jgi:HAD superfamily hydrolase (TIGR01509 family)